MKCQFYFLSYVDDSLVLRMFLEKYVDVIKATETRHVIFVYFQTSLFFEFICQVSF